MPMLIWLKGAFSPKVWDTYRRFERAANESGQVAGAFKLGEAGTGKIFKELTEM